MTEFDRPRVWPKSFERFLLGIKIKRWLGKFHDPHFGGRSASKIVNRNVGRKR